MINFQETIKVAETGKKASEKAVEDPSVFDQIINLLDVIVWPIALIVCLYLFKKQIGSIIDRFESANVSASGLAFKLREGTKKIGEGSSSALARTDGGMIAKSGEDMFSQSSGNFEPEVSQAESPYQGLMELQDAINYKLQSIATENGITSASFSNFALTNDLAKRGLLDKNTSSKLKTLIELNTLGLNSPDVTHEQVTQMKRLFNNISF